MDNDEQMIVVRLDSDALAPHLARAAIQEALSEQPADLRDIAVLLADEIVTNAVVHCGGRIEMSLEESPERIRIEVSDTSAVLPLVRPPTAGGGKGQRDVDRGFPGVVLGRDQKDRWQERLVPAGHPGEPLATRRRPEAVGSRRRSRRQPGRVPWAVRSSRTPPQPPLPLYGTERSR